MDQWKEVFTRIRIPAWVLLYNPSSLAPIKSIYTEENNGSKVHPELNDKLYTLPFSSRDE